MQAILVYNYVMERLIIDTRETDEFDSYHVSGAINIPPSAFLSGKLPGALSNVDKNIHIIVYCRTGNRASVAANMLKAFGFKNVTNGINSGHVEQLLGDEA